MTPERAQYILSNTVIGGDFKYAYKRDFCYQGGIVHPDGITEEEDRYIKAVWDKMPGWTNYHMAVCRIARGEVPQ